MERCPGCNARLRGRVVCARCQADLTMLVHSEQAAEAWLATAMEYLATGELTRCISALQLALALNKTQLAFVFRDFLIAQQTQHVVNLLAQKQILAAKQVLYSMRGLFAYSNSLQKLNAFSDYLLLNGTDNKSDL